MSSRPERIMGSRVNRSCSFGIRLQYFFGDSFPTIKFCRGLPLLTDVCVLTATDVSSARLWDELVQ